MYHGKDRPITTARKATTAPRATGNGRPVSQRCSQQRRRQQRQRDGAFAEDAEAAGDGGQQPPVPAQSRPAHRLEGAEQGRGRAERENAINEEQSADAHEAWRQAQHQGAAKGRRFAEAAPTDEIEHQNAAVDRQGRRQAGGPIVDAEELKAEGREPIKQGRLFEIGFALEARRDPIAALQHLARYLRVAALVRLEERKRHTRIEQQGRHKDEDQHRDGANRLGGGAVAGKEDARPEKRRPSG